MKKRLLISSVLMSAVLACALGTGTYAWYAATAGGSITPSAAVSDSVSAADDSYSVGENVSLTAAFGSVTENSLPTFADHKFADLELTNSRGFTYAYTTGGNVQQTATKPYGVAKVVVTLSDTTKANLAAITNGTDKVYTIKVSKAGNARVHAVAPSQAANDNNETAATYVHGDITLKLTVEGDGDYVLKNGENTVSETTNGVWEVKFYYSVANASEDSETSSSHASDAITVNIA